MEFVKKALALYGADLNPDGFIVKGCRATSVIAKKKGKRLRFELDGKLIASGPLTADWVSEFVERYWYWLKLPTTHSEADK